MMGAKAHGALAGAELNNDEEIGCGFSGPIIINTSGRGDMAERDAARNYCAG